ncbi:aldo/keto reductase [Planotetraspora phitsanulokensis]|uniref:Oxidoreductase n=1 Tax=Planotetraspora phitsanulokensis TaxID=575192 RepID=A0A8J3XFZ3_9ACTN|nr:aldo/keto reductase [Planotetraspora phitsanulokensis]GII40237.1 oxidoreductase [Planotetraspora phitsanulokensis]
MNVTPYGFGSAPIGNLYAALSDEEATAAIDAAWDAGIRYFDTAPHYGLGLSERRLGAALRGRPREDYVVSTKVGRLLVPNADGGRDDQGFDVPATHRRVWDFSRDGVRRSLEESLERLGLDSVDIALIHDPDSHYKEALSEAYPALAELRAEGVVKAIGAGMNQTRMLCDLVRETDIDVVLLAGRYSLLDRSGEEELLPLCLDRGVTVFVGGAFNSGLLATHDPAGTYDYAPAPAELLERAREMARVCERHGVTLPQAALAFPLRHPAVASVIVGMRSAGEVEQNAALTDLPIPEDLWADLLSV